MQQYDRLKHYCVISVLTLFIVIAASRPVNKNVSTGAVVRAKRCTEPGVHKVLANYQTMLQRNGWNGRIGSRKPTSLSFMNALTKSTQAWRPRYTTPN